MQRWPVLGGADALGTHAALQCLCCQRTHGIIGCVTRCLAPNTSSELNPCQQCAPACNLDPSQVAWARSYSSASNHPSIPDNHLNVFSITLRSEQHLQADIDARVPQSQHISRARVSCPSLPPVCHGPDTTAAISRATVGLALQPQDRSNGCRLAGCPCSCPGRLCACATTAEPPPCLMTLAPLTLSGIPGVGVGCGVGLGFGHPLNLSEACSCPEAVES